MTQKHIVAVTKTVVIAIVVVTLLVLMALASIGISYLAHDFNYFLFTVGGELLLLVLFSLFLIVREIRKHVGYKRLQN